jgi:hypothetical protein
MVLYNRVIAASSAQNVWKVSVNGVFGSLISLPIIAARAQWMCHVQATRQVSAVQISKNASCSLFSSGGII